MLARLSDPARSAVASSQDEARGLGYESISSGHLLLGLLGATDGIAAGLLSDVGVTPTMVLAGMLTDRLVETPGPSPSTGELPLTEEAMSALERAHEEAHRREDHYVGTGHMLLALVEDESPLAELLSAEGLKLSLIRLEVNRALAAQSEVPVDMAEVAADVQRFPKLTEAEELDLAKVISTSAEVFRTDAASEHGESSGPGSERSELWEARDQAVARFLQGGRHLALSVAQEYAREGHDPVYVYYEGVAALATSVIAPRWTLDWNEGERFSDYATSRMKEAVNELVRSVDR